MATLEFDLPVHRQSIIKVVGVGGGGSNAVTHMFKQGITGVDFVICNTDAQALDASGVSSKIQLGTLLTEGLGAGANPEKGKNAAIESTDELQVMLSENTKMVFITAGLGGGTGTGAAPEIAKIAKELGILTVGIVTLPFGFEGPKKMKQAQEGLMQLKENVDTLLVISNDKLREIHGDLKIREAFAKADDVLTTAAKGIAEIITIPGDVNVDFMDIKTVMTDSGAAVMGSATTQGENRAFNGAEMALASPLLNNTEIRGAKFILLNITSGEEEVTMDEVGEITEYIQDKAGHDAVVIWGLNHDAKLEDSINITVIVTGFELTNQNEPKVTIDLDSNKKTIQETTKEPELVLEEPEDVIKMEPDKVIYDLLKDHQTKNPEKVDENESAPVEEKDIPAVNKLPEIMKPMKVEEPIAPQPVKHHTQLSKEGQLRIEKLKNLSNRIPNNYNMKDMMNVPAYQRRKTTFDSVPHSSENGVSKYTLTDDNEILGNNKFLHDNVD